MFTYKIKNHKHQYIERNDMTFREMRYVNYIVWIAKMQFQHSKKCNKCADKNNYSQWS